MQGVSVFADGIARRRVIFLPKRKPEKSSRFLLHDCTSGAKN